MVMENSVMERMFTPQQAVAISLIRADLRFLFTVIKNSARFKSNYIISLMPYLGVIIDGTEDWIEAYNRNSKQKLNIPTFSKQEQLFYEEMRSAIKMWNTSYDELYQKLKFKYEESDKYFSTLCNPIAKVFHLYDVFGADLVNRHYCGNTILCAFYSPQYKFGCNYSQYGEYIKNMAEISGKYITIFSATKEYSTDPRMIFDCVDYGGFIKSPIGNQFSDEFILFSLLCQIQFALLCVDKFITEGCTTKLRVLYLQYYYSILMIKEYNLRTGTNIDVNSKWISDEFRNAMAHYKVGVALKTNEIIWGDPLFGLVQKFFDCEYFTLKSAIKNILQLIAQQIQEQLNLKQ